MPDIREPVYRSRFAHDGQPKGLSDAWDVQQSLEVRPQLGLLQSSLFNCGDLDLKIRDHLESARKGQRQARIGEALLDLLGREPLELVARDLLACLTAKKVLQAQQVGCTLPDQERASA